MVNAEDALRIYNRLMDQGIQIWLVGGWGIDALLGEHTRPHKDLDILMLVDDVERMRRLLEGDGYTLSYLWEENLPVTDALGVEIATAFVLGHPDGTEIDAHALRLDENGNGIPAWDNTEGRFFSPPRLAGAGSINGVPVQSISVEMQMIAHAGYALPEHHLRDLQRLHEKFGVAYPEGIHPPEDECLK